MPEGPIARARDEQRSPLLAFSLIGNALFTYETDKRGRNETVARDCLRGAITRAHPTETHIASNVA